MLKFRVKLQYGHLKIYKRKGDQQIDRKRCRIKSYEFVKKLLAAKKFTIDEIADFAGVTEVFVKKIKAGNQSKNNGSKSITL